MIWPNTDGGQCFTHAFAAHTFTKRLQERDETKYSALKIMREICIFHAFIIIYIAMLVLCNRGFFPSLSRTQATSETNIVYGLIYI